ncbi:hypothetical protein [Halococcus sp. AFM35]|uniref:hypothetical protein n=1 Tax=Halococcus sp. AFM35 TaxID=3421653 RepID=UPI003EB6CC9F
MSDGIDPEGIERPPADERVRCIGCDLERLWMYYSPPPDDVDALGTCPDCGTHIIGFDDVTDDDRAELDSFFREISWSQYR